MGEHEGQSAETPQGRKPFTVFAIWEQLGITEHLGGLAATRRLLEFCRITSGQRVLDLGCGTGSTACLLTKRDQVEVIAADISPSVLAWARRRVEDQGVSERVTLVEADAHALPFPEGTFDAVIAESVLVFCDQPRVSAEVFRVLKRGGVFGANELTYLTPPAPELRTMLASLFGTALRPLLADEWEAVFKSAGFSEVASTLDKIRLLEQVRSHLQVDGIRRYFSALYRGMADQPYGLRFSTKKCSRQLDDFHRLLGTGCIRAARVGNDDVGQCLALRPQHFSHEFKR